MAKRLAVVVSQGQSQHPTKRQLEEDIVARLLIEPGFDVTIVPHLYDLTPDSTGVLALKGIAGDMVVLSWLYPRAAQWTLDRHAIRGRVGRTLLSAEGEEDEDTSDHQRVARGGEEEDDGSGRKYRVVDDRPQPNRTIYCLDLRAATSAEPFLIELRRIAHEAATEVVSLIPWVQGQPTPEQLDRFLQPTNNTALGPAPQGTASRASPVPDNGPMLHRIDGAPDRRWYPVVDYSRCTNCMECIDFCLFGVYGIDKSETILVEQPDNCRKGCPACSRVCPENAIIFPQHKTPAIAGSAVVGASMKIDLSKLFGAPDTGEDAFRTAARERDEQLILAGREAVGMSVGIPKRQAGHAAEPKDELDGLLDQLDELDL